LNWVILKKSRLKYIEYEKKIESLKSEYSPNFVMESESLKADLFLSKATLTDERSQILSMRNEIVLVREQAQSDNLFWKKRKVL